MSEIPEKLLYETKIPMKVFSTQGAAQDYYDSFVDAYGYDPMELLMNTEVTNGQYYLEVFSFPTPDAFNPSFFSGDNYLLDDYVPESPIDYTITATPNNTTYGYVTGGGTYPQHSEITLNAYAYNGYKFDKWSNGVETSAYTFAVEEDANLVGNFADNTYTVTTRPSVPSCTTTGDGVYIAGTSVTVTATPAEGYYFTNQWFDEDTKKYVSTDAEYTFIVEKNTNLMALFATYLTVTATPNNVDYGSTTGSGNQYKMNDSVTVTATANTGYRFVNWTENGTEVSTSSSYTFTMNINDVTLVANFEPATANISISASPAGYGSVDAAGSTVIGESYTVMAEANTGYVFVNWTENGTEVSTSANYTFTVTGDRTLVANFDIDPLKEPFYVENITNANETLSIKKSNASAPTLTIEYSSDKQTWNTLGTTSETELTRTIAPGAKLYLRCQTNNWAASNTNYNTITGVSKVGGNIMSLLYGSNFTGNETTLSADYAFSGLFYKYGSSQLQSAKDLILPATTLTTGCYRNMFTMCGNLTTAPDLPATTLATGCYQAMFSMCSKLTTAPDLPATTLTTECYKTMFSSCGVLAYVKCLASTFGTDSTLNWLQSTSSTGTFVKATGVSWTTGNSGIPSGWTVVEEAVS